MKTVAIVMLGLVAAVPATPEENSARKVAVIAALSGEASIERAAREPARVRDWVQPGDGLSLDDGARLVVVFRSGRRFEVHGPARATVAADTLKPGAGIAELERLPPWPANVRPDEVRGGRAAGTRVRSGTIDGLSPADGDVVLAEDAWLRFRPEAKATGYALEVRDEQGKLVFQASVSEPEAHLPGGRLQPGREYIWAVEGIGTEASGEASFRTLEADTAEARRLIVDHLARDQEPDARVYLEALDAVLRLAKAR